MQVFFERKSKNYKLRRISPITVKDVVKMPDNYNLDTRRNHRKEVYAACVDCIIVTATVWKNGDITIKINIVQFSKECLKSLKRRKKKQKYFINIDFYTRYDIFVPGVFNVNNFPTKPEDFYYYNSCINKKQTGNTYYKY